MIDLLIIFRTTRICENKIRRTIYTVNEQSIHLIEEPVYQICRFYTMLISLMWCPHEVYNAWFCLTMPYTCAIIVSGYWLLPDPILTPINLRASGKLKTWNRRGVWKWRIWNNSHIPNGQWWSSVLSKNKKWVCMSVSTPTPTPTHRRSIQNRRKSLGKINVFWYKLESFEFASLSHKFWLF